MNQEEYNQLILELIQQLIKNQNEIIQLLKLNKSKKKVKFNI
jgi:hypothetical protein